MGWKRWTRLGMGDEEGAVSKRIFGLRWTAVERYGKSVFIGCIWSPTILTNLVAFCFVGILKRLLNASPETFQCYARRDGETTRFGEKCGFGIKCYACSSVGRHFTADISKGFAQIG